MSTQENQSKKDGPAETLALATGSAPVMPRGRDNIPLNHPRRIAKIAHLFERELAHESVEVRQLCRDFREKPLRAAYARAVASIDCRDCWNCAGAVEMEPRTFTERCPHCNAYDPHGSPSPNGHGDPRRPNA